MRAALPFICLCLAACGSATKPPLVATDIMLSKPVPGQHMSVGYLSLANNTGTAISITRVGSDAFEAVEMHESIVEDGVAKMRRIEKLTIPANSSVSFEPGGKHLMLMRASSTSDAASLDFYSGETLLLSVTSALTSRAN